MKRPCKISNRDWNGCGGIFDVDGRKKELAQLDEQIGQPAFWNDRQQAESISRRSRQLKESIDEWAHLKQQVDDLAELHTLAADEADTATLEALDGEAESLAPEIDRIELRNMLDDEDDEKNAILEIHSGAGGTEAADWAEMLMRLYIRWMERNNFQSEIMDIQPGDEAGIKGVTIGVTGPYAYGYLKAEAGVHRLVRISPFDANKRRHTSFASVFTYREAEDAPEVDLKDDDLQIDTYRAGGAGGQHVNKTSSAVRITHLPTKITVQCQNERSQFKNKSAAMKVLRARVYQLYKEEEAKKMAVVESSKMAIDFGSQIRSYVFHPYNLVKDHRTGFETGSVQSVMDGNIEGFIKAYLTQVKTV